MLPLFLFPLDKIVILNLGVCFVAALAPVLSAYFLQTVSGYVYPLKVSFPFSLVYFFGSFTLEWIFRAMRCRCSSLRSSVHPLCPMLGFLPSRNWYSGHFSTVHSFTSCADPQQQSRHFARIAFNGLIFFSSMYVHPF